ncbi:MAG: GNAT family N-acetyltransferase [Bdellovibrio sp.]|nr:GNAT family N-acetyltransferase [Bdellovibrio sp.]
MNLKMIPKLLKVLPESLRHKLYRHQATVPEFALDINFTVEIARTETDLEKAYSVLHDSYVTAKLMTPDQSGLRCNLYTFLPHTTVIVAKYKGEIVGTVSLIRDSIWGLPSDKDYQKENKRLRLDGNKLVEVSALAVSKNFRNSGNAVSLLLMKYLYNYAFHFLNSNCLVCTVHPRAEDFYKALWHFDRNGDVVSYQFVQGALAVHLSMDISLAKVQKVVNSYPTKCVNQNLALFVLHEDFRFKYPQHRFGAQIDPVFTPELFEKFCVIKTDVWHSLSQIEKHSLYSIYFELFGYCNPQLQVEIKDTNYMARSYRVPIELTTAVQCGDRYIFTKLTDLSAGGAFIAWPKDLGAPGSQIALSFKIGDKIIKTKAEVTWKNDGQSHLQPHGFGIKFLHSLGEENISLKNWLYHHVG